MQEEAKSQRQKSFVKAPIETSLGKCGSVGGGM